jgi:hypothetical protein
VLSKVHTLSHNNNYNGPVSISCWIDSFEQQRQTLDDDSPCSSRSTSVPLPIALTPFVKENFRIQLIVWKVKLHTVKGLKDLFVKVTSNWNNKSMKTDIHWRCKVEWNYRLLFTVFFTPRDRHELHRMTIQLYDKDVLCNTLLGQTTLDLTPWLLKAYDSPSSISIFGSSNNNNEEEHLNVEKDDSRLISLRHAKDTKKRATTKNKFWKKKKFTVLLAVIRLPGADGNVPVRLAQSRSIPALDCSFD